MFAPRIAYVIAAAACGLHCAQASAQGPLTTAFTYQGVLKQGGNPASGLFDMRFRLYDALTGGTQQGSAVCADNVSLTDGQFTVLLDFGPSPFAGQRRFLEIEVRPNTGTDCSVGAGFAALGPRQELAAVPPALHALSANGSGVTNINAANISTGALAVGRMPTGGFWTLGSSLVFDSGTLMVDPASNRVGVGTEAPAAGLHIVRGWDGEDGALRVEGDKAALRISSGPAGGNQSWMLHVGSDGPGNFGLYNRIAPGAWLGIMSITPSSRLGIGTIDPGARLHAANGDILAGESNEEWIFHTRTGFGGDFLQITDLDGGVAQFSRGLVIHENGNVGIGVTNPSNRLDINGTVEANAFTFTGVHGTTSGTFGSGSSCGVAGHSLASTGGGVGVKGNSASTSGFDFYASGVGTDYGSSSSRRWKRNVKRIPEPLAMLDQLRGVYFDWDAEHGGQHDVGFIAEEVGAVLPEIVQYEDNGIDASGMDYSKMTPLLVEAVKALRAENQALRESHRALEGRLVTLEAAVARESQAGTRP